MTNHWRQHIGSPASSGIEPFGSGFDFGATGSGRLLYRFFFFYFKGRLGVFTLNLSGNGFDYVEELNVFTSYGEGSINELNISNDSNYELLKTFINYKNIIILRLDYFFLFVASSKKLWPRCFFMAVCVCVYVTVEIFLYGYITKIRNGVRKKSTGRMFRQDHNN